MIIKNENNTLSVPCPNGDFISKRYLLESDGMGFTMTKTYIHKNNNTNVWHYKNHMEACICISGSGIIEDIDNLKSYAIEEGTMYALNKNDKHRLIAYEVMVLICVFNPPLKGKEVHKQDHSYEV
jgi:L-ectoine synthase